MSETTSENPFRKFLRWVGGLLLIGALLLGLATLLTWWLLPLQSEGRFPRQVERNVVIIGETLDVSVAGEVLPLCPVPPADIVLVLDASGSMEDVDERVRESVRVSLANMDWDYTQVGFVFSQDDGTGNLPPESVVALSSDPFQLIDTLDVYAGVGGTESDLGIGHAVDLLADAPPGNQRWIVVLSDGGTGTPETVRALVQTQIQAGTRFIFVGFDTGQDTAWLETLGSNAECCTFYAANNPEELENFYTQLPQLIEVLNRQVTLTLSEPLNLEAFSPLEGDTMDHVTQIDRGSETETLSQATLRANTLGWHRVENPDGRVQWADCEGQTTEVVRQQGPLILTLFPWWGWLIPILTGLFLLFASFWGRRKQPPAAETSQPLPPPDVLPPVQPPPTQVTPPAWLTGLSPAIPPDSPKINTVPTFYIGLGPTSRFVLERIAYNLQEIEGGKRPSNVHLLYLDVVPKDKTDFQDPDTRFTGATLLAEDERIVLHPDLEEYTQRLQTNSPSDYHLRWWDGNRAGRAGDDYDRAAARLGIYDSLGMGVQHSRLWEGLRRGVGQLNTSVQIIASAADWAGSSMAFDIAHLVRKAGGEGASVGMVSLFLLTHTVSTEDMVRTDYPSQTKTQNELGAAREFATFQEVARFSRNQPVRFRYNPAANQTVLDSGSTTSRLVDEIYVLEAGHELEQTAPPEENKIGGRELEVPKQVTSQQVVGSLADALTTLLGKPAFDRFTHNIQKLRSTTADLNNRRGDEQKTFVMSLGCHSYRVPIVSLRAYATVRLAYETLAYLPETIQPESVLGLFAPVYAREPDVTPYVSAWLRGKGHTAIQHAFWAYVANLAERRIEGKSLQTKNALDWFKVALLEKTLALLNGEDPDLKLQGGDCLSIAMKFGREVNRQIRTAAPAIQRDSPAASEMLTECLQWVETLLEDLDRWDTLLNKQERALKTALKTQVDEFEKEMQGHHHWVSSKVRPEKFYREYIRHQNEKGEANGQDYLAFCRARIGWLPAPGLKPALQLGWVSAFTGPEKVQRVNSDAENAAPALQSALLSLTHGLAAGVREPAPATFFADEAYRKRTMQWLLQRSKEFFSYGIQADQNAAAAGFSRTTLVAGQGKIGLQKLPEVLALDIKPPEKKEQSQTIDPTAPKQDVTTELSLEPIPVENLTPNVCSLIYIVGPVALSDLKTYQKTASAYRTTPGRQRLMVFEIEQLQAACQEKLGEGQRFRPELWAVLQDTALVKLFVELASGALIQQQEQGIVLEQKPYPVVLSNKNDWLEALRAFTLDHPVELKEALLHERRAAFIRDLQTSLRKRQEEQIEESEGARNTFEKIVSGLLTEPEDSLKWQLGIVFEHFL